MTVKYMDASTSQIIRWIAAGVCMWCGSERVEGPERFSCFCRRCAKCDRIWIAETREFLPNGTPASERCPECE